MMKQLGVVLVLAAGALAGCSSLSCGDPHPYLNSGANPPLKAPAGLSVPPPDPAYEIAGVTANAGKRTDLNAAGVCLINPPQVVPSASGGGTKQAGSSGSGAAQPPSSEAAKKSEPPVKPATGTHTPVPSAVTSNAVP